MRYKPVKVDPYVKGADFSVPDAHWLSLWAYKIPKDVQVGDHPVFKAPLFQNAKDFELIAEETLPVADPTHLLATCVARGIPMNDRVHTELLSKGESEEIYGAMIVKYKLRQMTNKDNLKHKG